MGSEEEQQHFAAIISTFLSTDNEVRTQAEANYDGISADKKIFFLVALIRHDGMPEDLRTLCAVLLRRLFTSHFDFAWSQLNPEAQKQVKEEMISLISRDGEKLSIRKKLCEVAAELARNLIDDDANNTWPDFLNFLFQCANSPSIPIKENALLIFALVPGIFGNQQANYLDLIKQMLAQSFASPEYSVRFYAGKALASFVTENEQEDVVLKHFSDLVQPYLKVMEESVRLQEDDTLLKMAIEMVSLCPKFMRPNFAVFLQLCLGIAQEAQLPDDWRHLALECAISAAEALPGAVKKIGSQFIPHFVQLMLDMMTELDDEDDWNESDEPVEEDSDGNAAMAESSLDRFACALGGKTVLPVVMSQVQVMLANPVWMKRYAGLMAISAVGEGCLKQMEAVLPQIIDPVIGFLKDPEYRVRYAACNALGQMATDFSPTYEKKFHSKILPGLIQLLQDNTCPRAQAHAGAALVNFCEECPRDILKNYAEPMIATLEQCFTLKLKELAESNKKLVLEQLVTTVASIANTLEEDFAVFYNRFMPYLKMIMSNANSVELRLLRGKTIECASLIGLAVGADKFTEDAAEIMDLLLRTQVDNGGIHLADDDPQLSYMITAWARICQILGDRFAPYLPMVMPPVLRTASVKTDLTMLDPDEVKDVEDSEDWKLINLGDSQNVGLHTARLEDKAMACQMLVCYARVMKTNFRPYVDEVVKMIIPLLHFYFHDSVRSSAAEIVPHLIECLSDNKQEQILLWNHLKNELFTAVEAEPESEVKSDQLTAISCSIELLPPEALDVDVTKKLTEIVEKVFVEHFEKSAKRAEQQKDEDYDEVVEQQLWDEMEEDNFVLTKGADILHALLSVQGRSYLPFIEPMVIPLVTRLIGQDRYWQERQWALCIWDDIMEYTGEAALKYQQLFLPLMIAALGDSSAEVRQAAAYGSGVMAQFGTEHFAHGCKEALPGLMRMINDPAGRNETNICATENAISAIAKIIKYCPSCLNVNEMIPMWLSWLPIWEDRDEMDSVYGLLCDLLESNNPLAIGHDGSNLPRIVQLVTESFNRDAITSDAKVRPRLIQILKMIQQNETLFQNCVVQLGPELQKTLQEILA